MLPVRYRSPAGSPLISVTQVLTLARRIDARWFTEESRWRGSTVHALTEQYDRGEVFDVPEGLQPYLDAYAAFKACCRPRYRASEQAAIDTVLRYGGRIDRECDDMLGTPGIIDLKTGEAQPWHALQLAAYNALRPTGARWCLYLQSNGRYKLRSYDDPADHRKFLYDLAAVQGTITATGDFWLHAA